MNLLIPFIESAVLNWAEEIEIKIVGRYQENFKTKESYIHKTVLGILQPASKNLEYSKDGTKSFPQFTLFAETDLELSLDDQIVIEGKSYRVIGSQDYSLYGYVQFDLVKGYDK